jgi:hypothetical protein
MRVFPVLGLGKPDAPFSENGVSRIAYPILGLLETGSVCPFLEVSESWRMKKNEFSIRGVVNEKN